MFETELRLIDDLCDVRAVTTEPQKRRLAEAPVLAELVNLFDAAFSDGTLDVQRRYAADDLAGARRRVNRREDRWDAQAAAADIRRLLVRIEALETLAACRRRDAGERVHLWTSPGGWA